MSNQLAKSLGFVIKTVILFCFVYDFIFYLLPTPLLSSRKISFAIILIYFIAKRNSIKPFLRNKYNRYSLLLCFLCLFYVILLNICIHGNGVSAIGTYVFFILYSFFGVYLFGGFFNWNLDKLVKALAVVTLIQATWCILTFYIWDIRLLNDALFVIDKDENVDFLSESRLRSIGAAGSSLSVCLALSSFSFLYFIVRGEKVLINTFFYLYCSFAILLSGTTGLLVCMASLLFTMVFSMTNGKRGFLFIAFLALFLFLFNQVLGSILDADQFRRLTEKTVGFFVDGTRNGTFESLRSQRVSGICEGTIIGTGLFRGSAAGVLCFHDSGYIRNYFALGLVMAVFFYLGLYIIMIKQVKQLREKRFVALLGTLLLMVMLIEYKEPYLFYYYPVFIFNLLFYAANKAGDESDSAEYSLKP